MTLFGQLGAFLRRDFLVGASYRVEWAMDLASGAVSLLVVWFLSRAVGEPDALGAYGGSYFAFALIGFLALGPTYTALTGMAGRVREAQVEGTFEALLMTPIAPGRIVLLSIVWPLLTSVVHMLILLTVAFWLAGVPVHVERLPDAAVVLVLAIVANGALGMLSAAFTIVLKRGDPVARVIETASFVFAGVLYPVTVLPEPVQQLAQLLPMTPALDAARRALLLGEGLPSMGRQVGQLALFAAMMGPVAWVALTWALRRARREGTLAHY